MIFNKLHVVTFVGTRPEIIRLSRVISQLESSKAINHTIIHTGQNYDYNLNEVFFNELEIPKPNYFLETAASDASETIGNILVKAAPILDKLKPQAVLILGDTNSCLVSIVAKKKKIPIFHMEAGNRCFDQNVPEETNRKIVDHIADINMPYSSIARDYLISEGIKPDRIVKTGSPMAEVLDFYSKKINNSKIMENLKLDQDKFFLVSAHREENVDNIKRLEELIYTLNILSDEYEFPIIFSTHPRTKKQLSKIDTKPSNKIIFHQPFGFIDYIALQKKSLLVLSDSGTISEEASILDFKAINIRSSHERPEAMEETSLLMSDINKERILQAIKSILTKTEKEREFKKVNDYDVLNVSKKVERIILSYTGYINKNVWNKES
ncbi:MAG: UDP-N-acetylglucosamine 2-epimerase (non-hydrolyzing) [Flavobacteriaceae bacterium TMED179]|nr:MAG: UDP-N-acetylglucosamine 2-epimerase (non-hydrolyzing) [Flavobacteriaceae bacterium TMED179]|tara:strand:- start:80860 stop:82002 length:1143 start_codon:yes stop_codon:yes gene_type:complete